MNIILPITETNEAKFEADVLKSKKPVLVSFYSPWSQPCTAFEPVLDEIAAETAGRVKIVTIKTDENPKLGMWYGIQFLPTMLFFVNGEIRARIVAPAARETVLSKIQTFMIQPPRFASASNE